MLSSSCLSHYTYSTHFLKVLSTWYTASASACIPSQFTIFESFSWPAIWCQGLHLPPWWGPHCQWVLSDSDPKSLLVSGFLGSYLELHTLDSAEADAKMKFGCPVFLRDLCLGGEECVSKTGQRVYLDYESVLTAPVNLVVIQGRRAKKKSISLCFPFPILTSMHTLFCHLSCVLHFRNLLILLSIFDPFTVFSPLSKPAITFEIIFPFFFFLVYWEFSQRSIIVLFYK